MIKIAIASGKGGTGKTFISTNLFYFLLNNNYRATLVVCDVDAANLHLILKPAHEENEVYISGHKAVIDYDICTNCGICSDYCRFDAISIKDDRTEISEISCDGCFLCSRICPENAIKMIPSDKSRLYSGSFRNGKMVYVQLAPGEENSGKLVSLVRDKAKRLSEKYKLPTIIIDGPPGIGCPVISSITGADKVVIVTEPSISGLHDMQRALDTVNKFNIEAYVIINKYDLNPVISGVIQKSCKANGVKVAGKLRFDPEMVTAIVQGKSITEYNPDLKISNEIKKAWIKILK